MVGFAFVNKRFGDDRYEWHLSPTSETYPSISIRLSLCMRKHASSLVLPNGLDECHDSIPHVPTFQFGFLGFRIDARNVHDVDLNARTLTGIDCRDLFVEQLVSFGLLCHVFHQYLDRKCATT